MSRSQILEGDVLEVLRKIPSNTYSGCLTDPPYGLTADKKGGSGSASVNLRSPAGRSKVTTGFMGLEWDADVPGPLVWAELRRVLVPGAFLLAFGGSRTHHRLMCALEDGGFELRDCIMWLYGSGFPKSLDISKAIDKANGVDRPVISSREEHNICRPPGGGNERLISGGRDREIRTVTKTAPGSEESATWNGYGTALKPAWEPIIVAMKPTDGTFMNNASKWGVAGMNIDAGRIPVEDLEYARNCSGDRGHADNRSRVNEGFKMGCGTASDGGRWPANVILDETAAALLDEQTGILKSGANPTRRTSPKTRNTYGEFEGKTECVALRGPDAGGASRFFYCAKPSTAERGEGNEHPTVKPITLCEYLARLILPPTDQRSLIVPYCGSGSEMIGAIRAGWSIVDGIENDPKWIELARKRTQSA